MDDSEALRRLRTARIARLATADATGRPHRVPVTFAAAPHTPTIAIAVDHKPKTTTNLRRLRNIEANERVSLLADHYDDEDWTRLWWVRLDGTARIVTTEPERGAPIAWLTAKYPQYQDRSPQGPVILITADVLTGWSYSE